MQKRKNIEKIKLDQMTKMLFRLSKNVTINLLNGLFNENYNPREVDLDYGNSEFIDEKLRKRNGDIYLTVHNGNKSINYHIELQTLNDSSMAIRMFRYGFEKAVEQADISAKEKIKLYFPKQIVIFLEENNNIKEALSLSLELPDGNDVLFEVPVMKYWEYSSKDLKDKKMYALLPLQVFNVRKSIIGIEKSSKSDIEKAQLINLEIKRLMNIIKETLSIVDDLSRSKEILGSDLEKILLVLNNISEYLYNNYGEYEKVSKEVFVMLKTLVDPVVMNEGIEKGIQKGIEKGIEKGELKNQQRLALKLLKKKLKDIPSDIEETINCIDDIDVLEKVIDNIFDINSVDQVKEMLKKD